MKRATKIALMTGASLCIVGAALFGVGVVAGGRGYVGATNLNSLRDTEEYSELQDAGYLNQLIEDNIRLDEFRKLSIDCENLDVSIVPTDKNYSYLSYELEADKKGNNPLTYRVVDDTLTLEEKNGGASGTYIRIDINFIGWLLGDSGRYYDAYHKNLVTLHLAKDVKLDASEIALGDGDLSVESVTGTAVDWQLGYGDLTITDCTLSGGTITVKDGDIVSDHLTGEDVIWVNQYGDWNAKNCTLRGGGADLDDGDLTFNQSSWTDTKLVLAYGDLEGKHAELENITVTMKDGDVELDALTLSGDNTITSRYGDVEIELTAASKKNPMAESQSEADNGETGYRLEMENGMKLSIDCDDGDISVE
ncbi:MAG: DUF4097 family beta strand repeat-containing protein [Butyricicoccus sp.]